MKEVGARDRRGTREGEVSPSTFLPIAEETGLIVPLGEWILKTARAYATTWPDDTRLAVNLSPGQCPSPRKRSPASPASPESFPASTWSPTALARRLKGL
jgi:EAL domain-containing protein (putative c-di-GMP-specific phosphodiesterase class I)